MNEPRTFKKGDLVRLRIGGAGVVSHENDVVWKVSRGRVFLIDSAKEFGLDGKWLDEAGDPFGWTFAIEHA